MPTIKSMKQIVVLSIALVGLVIYNFTGAWTPPPANPPNNNVAAPINTSATTQTKSGNLAANILAATTEVRSDRYCDSLGQNCTEVNGTGSASGGDEVVWYNSVEQIYSMEDGSPKTINLVSLGLPPNIKRLFLLTHAESKSGRIGGSEGYDWSCSTNATQVLPHGVQHRLGAGWVDIKDSQLTLEAKQNGNCYTGSSVSLTVDIGGYECQGSCGDASSVRTCSVRFTYDVHGKTGDVTKTVMGDGDMGLGVWADDDNYRSLPFTESLAVNNWGGSTFDSGEKAGVGYFDGPTYEFRRTELTTLDADSYHFAIVSLPLTPGQTKSVSNQKLNHVPAGTANITATVLSCTS